MAATVTAASKDTIITIPETGGICRVDQPSPGGGREIFLCAPQTVGKLLANLEDREHVQSQKWLDLLGISTPGVAIGWRAKNTYLVLAFPARVKTVKADVGNGTPVQVPYNLPPTVWMLGFNAEDTLASSYLWIAAAMPRSVRDEVRVVPSPYGNVHPGGAVCWGNVATRPLSPTDPVAADNLFWGTGFNNHLVYPEQNFILPIDAAGRRQAREYTAWVQWQIAHPGEPLTPNWDVMGGRTLATALTAFIGGTLRE
jgi:hypothetical protein